MKKLFRRIDAWTHRCIAIKNKQQTGEDRKTFAVEKLCLLLLFTLYSLLFTPPAFAVCDYAQMCAPKAYDLSSKGSQVASNVTGMTFLSEKIADLIIKSQIKKITKGKLKVNMQSYSAKDLLKGRFKSLKISGRNLEVEGAYISKLEAKTLCDFNYVKLNTKSKSIKFKENMVMAFSTEVTNADLQKTVKSAGYLEKLNQTNLSAFGITFFKLQGADVQIKNNMLYFTINITTPFSSTPIPAMMRSGLKVEEGNIVLTKIGLLNSFTVIDLSKATYILNAINPLTFSVDILNNKDSKMTIQTVDIVGDKIIVKGTIFIPKNV